MCTSRLYICSAIGIDGNHKSNQMLASELKIGDTFRRDGFKFTVVKITPDQYKNGTPCIIVECTMNDSKLVDSFFSFKLTTKIK